MLLKEIVDARTDARTHARMDDGRRTLKDHKSSLSTSYSGELKNTIFFILKNFFQTAVTDVLHKGDDLIMRAGANK